MIRRKVLKFYANIAAAKGKTKAERRRIRQKILIKYRDEFPIPGCDCAESGVFSRVQDLTFPLELKSAKNLMVVLVPEHNAMSGGIYSFFSIADKMRRLKNIHGFEVIVMTRPNFANLTYYRNTNFINCENVYRFDQILLCKDVVDLYIHIPEYATETFVSELRSDVLNYLLGRKNLYVNILNQNIQLMPDKSLFSGLREISTDLTQSVAHHAYFSQHMADKYDLPTLLLPAYTDLSAYQPSSYCDKEKLIIYSPDIAAHKQACLDKIAERFPDFKLVEIRGITFDRYMDLATRCMFSITFGEGFDGYLAQPIQMGGVGFAIYSDEFFPSEDFKKYFNIFLDDREMIDFICDRMSQLINDEFRYNELSKAFQMEYKKLYDYGDYISRLRKLSLREFEIFPQ